MIKLPDWVDRNEMAKDARFDEQGRWLQFPLNDIAVPPQPGESQRHIILRDDTLRSGGNTPGVYASIEKKLRIAAALDEMGVKEAEVGYGSLAEDQKFVRALLAQGTRIKLGMHARSWLNNWKQEIDCIAECGAQLVNFVGMQGYPVVHALHPHLTGEAFLQRMEECIAYAKSLGLTTVFGTDCPQIDLLDETVRRAVAAGVDRWVVYDTRGWFLPQTMAMLVGVARKACEDKIEITVHAHDDFGLAAINTLEGIRAGAVGCDVTINRTGHRCGNAALEQVAVGLEYFYNYATDLDLTKINSISRMVSELYEVPVAENAPLVGHNMFGYGGLHISAIVRGDWFLWENVRAEAVGGERHIIYGPTALQRGANSPLDAKVASLGKSPSELQMERIISGIRSLIDSKKFATDAEVEQIITRVMG
jgi:isopropylmalate/homocitrate/citramalate synthase